MMRTIADISRPAAVPGITGFLALQRLQKST